MHKRVKCAGTGPALWRPCVILAVTALAMPLALAQKQSATPAEVGAA